MSGPPGKASAVSGVREGDAYAHLREACDAVATAAENAAHVFRDRASGGDNIAWLSKLTVAQGFEQFAVELREISSGEGSVRATRPPDTTERQPSPRDDLP